jgi:hypothetical protein
MYVQLHTVTLSSKASFQQEKFDSLSYGHRVSVVTISATRFNICILRLLATVYIPCSIPGQSMWDLWWTKWYWYRFFPEYFGSSLSISFHRCSITWKNKKTNHISLHFIFIKGLHIKPSGCGASVSSAAGPFTTKKNSIS